jgi:MoxR-like ATPase
VTLLVGRDDPRRRIEACLRARRNVLLEGPVGVGKTHLALAIAERLGLPLFRVDGDGRYSEQKLTGWFDPPTVIQSGYGPESFLPGPLFEAMSAGGLLLVNELNRLPEGVQNVLLPAIDERLIAIPRLGEFRAQASFRVIATQNPREFVATSRLSEALLDRFELIVLDYQSEAEENEIVLARLRSPKLGDDERRALAATAVAIARATRSDPRVQRGASVRAAIAIAEIAAALAEDGVALAAAIEDATRIALPTRIEIARDFGVDPEHASADAVVAELARSGAARLEDPPPRQSALAAARVARPAAPAARREGFDASEKRRVACYDDDLIPDLAGATDWDVATRYADFGMPLARGTVHEAAVRRLRAAGAQAIVRRAREVLGSVVHPTRAGQAPWTELPEDATRVEVAVEETLEAAPLAFAGHGAALAPDEVWMDYERRRSQPLVLCLDTSLSMQGEKLALMGVAVGVVLLQFPEDPVGVIGFDDAGRVLKRPDEAVGVVELVERLLDVPGLPYTNLEAGLACALEMAQGAARGSRGRPVSTVLVTDGKYTAGSDPAHLASRFAHLAVLKVGTDRAGLPLCRELAARGQGAVREAGDLAALPLVMYGAIQELLRGRA